MSKVTVFLLTALVLALAGVIAWGFITTGELNETKEELSDTRTELEVTKNELADSQKEVSRLTGELEDTEDELADTEAELASTKEELTDTESELSSTKSTLSITRNELTSTKNDLADANEELESTTQQLATALETLDGLGISLATSAENHDADLIDNPEATNPTWAELKTFILNDLTNNNRYVLNEYDCSEFSRDVHNNAEASGIRAAVVHVSWRTPDIGHALNAFITADYGLVYVDCTGGPDTVANVKPMRAYRAVQINQVAIANIRQDWYWNSLMAYYYIPTASGGQSMTDRLIIYW